MSDILEIHGLKATRVQAGPETHGMPVTVTDSAEYVVLSLDRATYPAGLTSAEARYVATLLNAAADRLDKRCS